MTDQPIQYAESPDGTPVAYRRFGSGRAVVFVGGALSTAEAARPLAAAFAEAGLQGVTYDRRGRGDSGDTAPYAPEREAEDLRAVIDAVGGAAVVLGHSSGAVLSLFGAAEGVPMTHLFLSEPPLRFGQNEPPGDLADRLQALVDQGENEEAVLIFLREDVGMPEPAIEQLRGSPAFAGLVPLAQTTPQGKSRHLLAAGHRRARSGPRRQPHAAVPVLPRRAHAPPPIPLTLRALCGLTTRELADAFLVKEATMAQRISRAKATIRAAPEPFALPTADAYDRPLRSVLHVLYLMFNEGHVARRGAELDWPDLAARAFHP